MIGCRPCVGTAIVSLVLSAPVLSQQRPPTRPLGRVLATSDGFGAISAVRTLSGGTVLVNDPATRRVVMLDSMLRVVKVVADSTPTTARAYGSRVGGLIAFRGDSSLFVDPTPAAMIVIDPGGNLTRVIAAPSRGEANYLVGGLYGNPGIDSHGRLIYRGVSLPKATGPMKQVDTTYDRIGPDSTPLLRFDLLSRKLDTAAFLRVSPDHFRMTRTKTSMSGDRVLDPIPIVDDFAVTPDGRVAILRGREYRMDWLREDGAIVRGQKIPFDWQRLSDDDKTRIVDSVRAQMEARRGGTSGVSLAPGPATSAPSTTITTTMTVDPLSGVRQTTMTQGAPSPAPFVFAANDELSDYRPAFALGAMRSDAQGRLWVRTIPTESGTRGVIYDVIDSDGKLAERVIIPTGTTVVGFGAEGTVLLGVRDSSGTRLVRVRER